MPFPDCASRYYSGDPTWKIGERSVVATMSSISLQITDSALGIPANDIRVKLERFDGTWIELVQNQTNQQGKVAAEIFGELGTGHYRLSCAIGTWFAKHHQEYFYVNAQIEFQLSHKVQHYHLPLFISPWAWSSYQDQSVGSNR